MSGKRPAASTIPSYFKSKKPRSSAWPKATPPYKRQYGARRWMKYNNYWNDNNNYNAGETVRSSIREQSGLVARLSGTEKNVLAQSPQGASFRFSYSGVEVEQKQLDAYSALFSNAKVLKMIVEFWLPESDEETSPNYIMPTVYTSYEHGNMLPASNTQSLAAIIARPNHKMRIARPGTIYKLEFVPKIGRIISTTTGTVIRQDDNPIWLTNQLDDTHQSFNGFWGAVVGKYALQDQIIKYRETYVVQFWGRTNGYQVNE